MTVNNVLGTAVSGLQAAATQAAASANNIANQNTPGFQRTDVNTTSLVAGGGQGAVNAGVQAVLAVGENVDLGREFVDLIQASTLYKANAAVIRTAEEMFEHLPKGVDTNA